MSPIERQTEIDQGLREAASYLGIYYRELMHEHFDAAQAMCFVSQYHQMLLATTLSAPPAENTDP